MTSPIEPVRASDSLDQQTSEEILRYELQVMSSEREDLEKYRAYYDGNQGLVFGTEKFKDKFGDAFKGFRDNWCSPVVEALADKLHIEGIRIGTTEEEIEANKDTARSIWNIFRANDIDEQQADLHEGALVEGRSYAIAWPDDELDVRIDWNPADLIRVRYADDDPRKIIWAMKRWFTPSGQTYITVYTRTALYKYIESARELKLDARTGMNAQRPTLSPTFTFEQRRVPNESWPLPNPYNIVPVVEFLNKRGSELTDVIPLQDGVNYLMLQGFSAAGFMGFPQRGFFSGTKEPTGGWSNDPGRVWQVPPDIDPEGNLHYGTMFQFDQADLGELRSFVEMVLQHIALQTKTPVRMFFQSDRGGRGDAPSGESLLVEDQPLLDKTEDRQRRYGNGWFRLAKMVSLMSDSLPDKLDLGEMRWHDPRSKYRSALIEEGAKMVEKMGIPLRFVATQLGLTEDEQEILLAALDEQEEEQIVKEQRQVDMQVEVANQTRPPVASSQNQ